MPEYRNTNVGMGSSGVDPDSQLAQDLYNMSDQAKRVEQQFQPAMEQQTQQNLDAAFGDTPDGQMQTLASKIADGIEKRVGANIEDGSAGRKDYASWTDQLQAEVDQLRKQQEKMQKANSNHPLAKAVYAAVGRDLEDRIRMLHDQNIRDMEEGK